MTLGRMGHLASERRHAERIGEATSMISGPRIKPRSHARLSMVSVRFTTSSETLPVSLPMSVLPRVKSTASQKSKHSVSGPKRN